MPVAVLGALVHALLMRVMSYFPALAVTMLVMLASEAAMLSFFRLIDLKALLTRFFGKKRKKIAA